MRRVAAQLVDVTSQEVEELACIPLHRRLSTASLSIDQLLTTLTVMHEVLPDTCMVAVIPIH
jgi:hypothetical protein